LDGFKGAGSLIYCSKALERFGRFVFPGIGVSDFTKEDLQSGEELSSSRIVSARGTEEGLILRIDGRADWHEIQRDVKAFLNPKKKFFEGEWLDRLPTKEQSSELEEVLSSEYGIAVTARKKPEVKNKRASVRKKSSGAVTVSLLDGGVADKAESKDGSEAEMSPEELLELAGVTGGLPEDGYLERMEKILGEDVLYEDDANTKTVFGTVRSGQRVETPFSLIVVGDVNPGADLVAGGDIFVIGALRGTAHAAAYDEDATGRVIIALQMRPIQLRIGSVISRGSDDEVGNAEIARIEDRRIIVESYNSRMNFARRLRA
jgi:septum site-determining protein MinC